MDYVSRFLASGLIVSAFAVLGDACAQEFAGLFGAAPSVALSTLTLAFLKGPSTVAIKSQSMFLGALAFLLFGFLVCQLLTRFRMSAVAATSSTLVVRLIAALGLRQIRSAALEAIAETKIAAEGKRYRTRALIISMHSCAGDPL